MLRTAFQAKSLVLLPCLLLLIATPLMAQNTTSALRVEVTDTDGGAIAGVAITLVHLPTGRTQVFVANDDGIADAKLTGTRTKNTNCTGLW